MNSEILETPSTLDNHAAVREANIKVDHPFNWLALSMKSDKNICISFMECYISFYECLFTQIIFLLPLFEFKVKVLRFLKVAPHNFILTPWVL